MFLSRNPLTKREGRAKLSNPRIKQRPFTSTETIVHMCRKKTHKSHVIIIQHRQTRIQATLLPTLLDNLTCETFPELPRGVNKTVHSTLELNDVLWTNIQSMQKLRRRCAKDLSLNFVLVTLKKSRLNITFEKWPLGRSCQSESDHACPQR